MSFNTVGNMTDSMSLVRRIAACYASQEGATGDPQQWAMSKRWQFAAQPGWADAWSYAESTKTINVNQDTGAREDVIGDDKILSAVQSILNPPASTETTDTSSTTTDTGTSTETPAS